MFLLMYAVSMEWNATIYSALSLYEIFFEFEFTRSIARGEYGFLIKDITTC